MNCCWCSLHHWALSCVQGQDVPGLVLADMHCLPGMEGGPVVTPAGELLGVLCQPLCSQSFQAEVGHIPALN